MIIYDKNGRGHLRDKAHDEDHDLDRVAWCNKNGFYKKWLCLQKRGELENNGADQLKHAPERANIEKEYVLTLSDWYDVPPNLVFII